MSEEKKYRFYTAADIEKYHRGSLSPKEMHELEKAALDDPFLADALEGFGTTSVNISADIPELEKKLQQKVRGGKLISISSHQKSFKWWRVAAAVIILGTIGFFTFRLSMDNTNKSVADLENRKTSVESSRAPLHDSGSLVRKETTGITDGGRQTVTIATPSKKKSGKSLHAIDSNNLTAGIPNSAAKDPPDFTEESYDSAEFKKNRAGILARTNRPVSDNSKRLEEFADFGKQNTQTDSVSMNYFRGRVTDVNNRPLPFANVTNTRDKVGTYADARGNFTLISPDSVLDVQVRSIGFETNFARLKDNTSGNNVVLLEDKAAPDKIISYKKPDTDRSRDGSMKLEEPEPADGWTNYDTYLANNINVPDDLKRDQNRGLVELSFEVNQNGDPVNIRVERSLCRKCDEEAVRLIRQGPKWKKKNKKTKRVSITVPFEGNQ